MSQETPIELNIELATGDDTPEHDIETLECELEPLETPHKWTKKSFASYRSKLRLMDDIHNAIADKVNQKRQASFEAFFREEDSYIPETKHNDFSGMMIASLANNMPAANKQ